MQWKVNETHRCQIQHDTRIVCKNDNNHDIPIFQRYDFGYVDQSTCASSICSFEKENHGKLRNQNDATANFQLFLRILYFFYKFLNCDTGQVFFRQIVRLFFSLFVRALSPQFFCPIFFSFLILLYYFLTKRLISILNNNTTFCCLRGCVD